MVNKINTLLIFLLLLSSCNPSTQNVAEQPKSIPDTKQKLLGINYQLTEKDRVLIKAYIDRHRLTMKEMGIERIYDCGKIKFEIKI